jgi:hypothetical protein
MFGEGAAVLPTENLLMNYSAVSGVESSSVFDLTSGSTWYDVVFQAKAPSEAPSLYAVDDGTFYTGETPNVITFDELSAMRGPQFFFSISRGIGIYDSVLTGALFTTADTYFRTWSVFFGGYDPNLFFGSTAPEKIDIDTYDGANEVTHPSVWDSKTETGTIWNGYRYWMAITPYADSNSHVENPCIYASNDLETWIVPTGLTNPIDPYPGEGMFNSDTHLVWGKDGYLYCFWRKGTLTNEIIYYLRSSDGVVWSDKTAVITSLITEQRPLSPAIIHNGQQWVMYAVDLVPSPNTLIKSTSDSLSGPWSAFTEIPIEWPSGYESWHLDAHYFKNTYLLLIQNTTEDVSGTGILRLGFSFNGDDFTMSDRPMILPKGNWHDGCYRSSIIPAIDNDRLKLDLIYAGLSSNVWNIGRSSAGYVDLTGFDGEALLAVQGISPYLGGDDFDREDGLVGSTVLGQVWSADYGTPGIVAGNFTEISGSGYTQATLDSGVSDGYFELNCDTYDITKEMYLVFRRSNTSNRWRFGFNTKHIYLQKIVAGTATDMYVVNLKDMTDFAQGVRLGVNCVGDKIELYVDKQYAYTVTDTHNNTASVIGLQIGGTTTTIKSILWRSPLSLSGA